MLNFEIILFSNGKQIVITQHIYKYLKAHAYINVCYYYIVKCREIK